MIVVEKPGLLTTVQDQGRPGFLAQGVPGGGAADAVALRIGNWLVGNDGGAAGLEFTMTGPVLRFERAAVIALTGARVKGVEMYRRLEIAAGERLDLSRLEAGCRGYLVVAGGVDVPLVMGSRSTYLMARLGGWEGRALVRGDRLGVIAEAGQDAGRELVSNGKSRRTAAASMWTRVGGGVVRVMRGGQWDWFGESARRVFLESELRVSEKADRMGLRLEGDSLSLAEKREMTSEGVSFGTVQVPPDGGAIVLLADGQTIGGYPKIGQVIRADWGVLAQCRPGDSLRFEEVTMPQAEAALREMERNLGMLRVGLSSA